MNEIKIDSTIQGKNALYFSMNDKHYCYERLTNGIHRGTREEVMDIFMTAESVEYKPRFEGKTLIERKTGNLEALLLNVTETCNLRCGYCIYGGNYEGERSHGKSMMDIETAKKAIDIFAKKTHKQALVGFYGGEPTVNNKLIGECVSYCKERYPEKEFVFSMTTNLYTSEAASKDIVKREIYAAVSLDGPKHVHDKQRRSLKHKPTHDRIMAHLDIIEKESPGYTKSHMGINSTCDDAEDFDEIMKYLIDNNDNFFSLRANFTESKGAIKRNGNTTDVLAKYGPIYVKALAEGREPPKVLKHFFDHPVKVFYNRSAKHLPEELGLAGSCVPLERKLFVDTDGKFYMCEKTGRRNALGDVDKGIDEKAIDECIDQTVEIRNDMCGSCWGARACTSCIQSAKDPDDELSVSGLKSKCGEFKLQTLIGLALYTTIIEKDPSILERYFDRRDKNGIQNK